MRVILLACLLIGSTTCGPVGKGSGSNNAVPNKQLAYPWGESLENSELGISSSLPSQYNQNPIDAEANTGGDVGDGSEVYTEPQPVFSDVSDLEPVYSFSSRSRYQRGRATFVQTHYSPGDPFFPPMPVYNPPMPVYNPPMPVYNPPMKTGSEQRSLSKALPKGSN